MIKNLLLVLLSLVLLSWLAARIGGAPAFAVTLLAFLLIWQSR